MKAKSYSFFWWLAGAKIEYLKKFPTEHEKYFHMGMTIFVTWLLATLGGTYAANIIFNNIFIAILAGMLWGLIIFNLDRYMMVTIKKQGNELRRLTLGEKISNFLNELIPTIPRIIIAIILGIIITTPIEIYLFQDQINNNLKSNEQALILKHSKEIHENYLNKNKHISNTIKELKQNTKKYSNDTKKTLSEMKERISELEKNLSDYQNKIKDAQKEYDDEYSGTGGTGKAGPGPSLTNKTETINNLTKDANNIRSKLNRETKKRDEFTNQFQKIKQEQQTKVQSLNEKIFSLSQQESDELEEDRKNTNFNGFISQIEILHSTISEQSNGNGDKTLYNIHIILMTLILIIEISPILFKILSARGPYEAYIDLISSRLIMESDSELKISKARFKKIHIKKD